MDRACAEATQTGYVQRSGRGDDGDHDDFGSPKVACGYRSDSFANCCYSYLNRLNNDSELIVVTASGGSIWRIARPLLLLAAFVAGLVAFVNHIGMPWSLRMLRAKITEVRSDLISQVLLPGRFSTPENGVVVHIRSRGLDGTLYGLLISDHRKKTHMSYLAERGKVVKQDGGSYLVMENGHICVVPTTLARAKFLRSLLIQSILRGLNGAPATCGSHRNVT